MAKSFKDSPAMAFLSQPPKRDPDPDEQPARHVQAPAQAQGQAQRHAQTQKEYRTKRLPLMLTPSMYEQMLIRAGEEGISLNELATRAITKILEQER
ncbi:hypothetical protein [Cloacibacillus porcorum]|uniref:hypothetical protein n=1 Tax=Cloacibacillus porcorum TaxID=1197717 RepID=UPI0026730BF8|nr:hypothetical protein [Cloacibacillus porcorum]